MKIVFLDAKTIGDDIDLSVFGRLGEVERYDFSTPEQVRERTKDADVLILNKVQVNEETIKDAKNLKLVCVTATGTDNLDKEYLKKRNIAWRNVAGYSTESVAGHTFAMLFFLLEKLSYYDGYVKQEKYVNDIMFTHFSKTFRQLHGQTWGIVGLGNIGKRVADIAAMFGCNVIYYSTSGTHTEKGYHRVGWQELLEQSDIISVHAPLNEDTRDLMNWDAFCRMKSTAIFLNVGRGQIVVEEDLAKALETGEIAAAGLDVLRQEPMREENPLRRIKDSEKLLITPHIAWASVEARTNLMQIIYNQIEDYVFSSVKAVVFDLDGTLLNTLEDLTDAVNYALEQYRLPTHSNEAIASFIGNGVETLIARAIDDGRANPLYEPILEQFRSYYAVHCEDKTAVYPGVMDVLATLHEKNLKMAIVSNKIDSAVKKLNLNYFSEYIQIAIGDAPDCKKKPEPDMLLKALRQLDVKPHEVLYVGDSDVDILTAERAGVTCVSATWGYRSRAFLEQNHARYLIDQPMQLLDYLRKGDDE